MSSAASDVYKRQGVKMPVDAIPDACVMAHRVRVGLQRRPGVLRHLLSRQEYSTDLLRDSVHTTDLVVDL